MDQYMTFCVVDADITPEDFFEKLSSGVILCRLAKYISEQEVQWKGASSATPFKVNNINLLEHFNEYNL